MSGMVFNTSREPTVGVEIELALVDTRTMRLCSASERLLPVCRRTSRERSSRN